MDKKKQCSATIWGDWGSSHRCGNIAKEDGLCGVHLRSRRQREEREVRWNAQERELQAARDAVRLAAPTSSAHVNRNHMKEIVVTMPLREFLKLCRSGPSIIEKASR